jgi:hypothetical protein
LSYLQANIYLDISNPRLNITFMSDAQTYGHRFTIAVGEYLTQNNLKSLGAINSRILAEIAQRFHDNERKVKRQKVKLASDEEWLKEIEAEPATQGIDVRKELGKCQFWCKSRNRVCTRRMFERWLLNPNCERTVTGSYDGATSRPKLTQVKRVYGVNTIVPGWAMLLRTVPELNFTDAEIDAYCAQEWEELPVPVREKIIKVA